MVRDPEGEWSLPQFVTLTGGSVGWQAGVQGSDIVLVFTTQKGVQGLMQGKFTIGADVAAAAGPVGRNASASTDTNLKAEILSYSRSRGLFLGVSIDGSALEIDHAAHAMFYGSQSGELPRQIPVVAAKLRQDLVNLTPNPQLIARPAEIVAAPIRAYNPTRMQVLRTSLDQSSRQLLAIVNPEWQQFLALPVEIYNPNGQPRLDMLRIAVARYDLIASNPDYKALADRAEFQRAHELLREYTTENTAAADTTLKLPPPPPSVTEQHH